MVLCKQNKHITMIATLLLLLSYVDWHLWIRNNIYWSKPSVVVLWNV